jgi:hypothetical protein
LSKWSESGDGTGVEALACVTFIVAEEVDAVFESVIVVLRSIFVVFVVVVRTIRDWSAEGAMVSQPSAPSEFTVQVVLALTVKV